MKTKCRSHKWKIGDCFNTLSSSPDKLTWETIILCNGKIVAYAIGKTEKKCKRNAKLIVSAQESLERLKHAEGWLNELCNHYWHTEQKVKLDSVRKERKLIQDHIKKSTK